jgi:uncharacterized protein (DUF302 family)
MITEMTSTVGIGRRLDVPFDVAMERTRAALKDQGFGVLTEIDMQQTMKEKLHCEFRRYTILGACNPPFAHRALTVDLEVGLLLPCNVVLYEDGTSTVVQAMDPRAVLSLLPNPEIANLAGEVRDRLIRALDALGNS